MNFEFHVLGLLVVFMLISLYYSRNVKIKDSISFRRILICSYILEFMYIVVFIAITAGKMAGAFSKLYLIITILFYSFIGIHLVYSCLKEKYVSKQSFLDSKMNMINKGYFIFNVISIILILIFSVEIKDGVLSGNGVYYTYIVSFLYMLFSFIIIFKNGNDILKKRRIHLIISSLIGMSSIMLQIYFFDKAVMNAGSVLIVLYMYLTLDNYLYREIDRLRLEKEHALKNSTEKGSFMTSMSHEVRTPLSTIDGLSQVILDSDDIEEIKGDALDIRVASRNLIDIINGIVDISIIESGNLEIIKDNYNVYDMLDNVVDITKSRIKNNEVKFVVDIDKDIPEILNGDAVRIEQVFLNLLMNAIKYTKEGTITFKVEAIKSLNMCRLKVSVIDTGIGIKEEDIDNIFDGIRDSNGKNRDGYSLGLLVSKQLLELMDGKIDVSSTYGKGSTFVVTIDQKIINDDVSLKKVKRGVLKPFDSNGKRIMIVDDNKLNIKVASKLLEPYNVSIKEAMSGQECLDILDKDNNFDLILMDDMMPHMSGTETMDILKKIGRVDGFSIPVVVLTANAVNGIKNKYLSRGFDDYLAKPIDRYELDRVLKKFLKNDKD